MRRSAWPTRRTPHPTFRFQRKPTFSLKGRRGTSCSVSVGIETPHQPLITATAFLIALSNISGVRRPVFVL
jgi:hypothetical protein